jgi:adenosylhomocysteine nucleosidase
VAALAAESRPLGRTPRPRDGPASLADGTLLIVSGVGPAAAGQGARRLAAAGAKALISWGMAGGLDPALAAGTVVLPIEVMSPEGALFSTSREWRERLCAALAARHPVCCGRLLTCRDALSSPAEKAHALRQTAAAAVDMESSAVAEVAANHRLPFLVVRAIVDTAGDALPRAALTAASAGARSVRIGPLLTTLVRTPAELPGLVRLARRYRVASRALAAVARSGALAPQVVPREAGPALS